MSYLLIFIAAFFNAVMDRTTEPVHFNISIFRNLNQKFWLRSVSWQYAKKVFGWKADAWHIAKSFMVISLVCAIVFYESMLPYYVDILVMGALWNLSFNLFYNRLLKK